jgi:hypothetical protein
MDWLSGYPVCSTDEEQRRYSQPRRLPDLRILLFATQESRLVQSTPDISASASINACVPLRPQPLALTD